MERLKSKAIELGAEFIKGEVKSISEIKAKTIISAAGCWTKELLRRYSCCSSKTHSF